MKPRIFIMTLLLLAASGAAAGDLPKFANVTQEAGIAYTHSFGDETLSNIIESTGAGCAMFDYDNDGFLDIYLLNGCYMKGLSDVRSRALDGKLTNALYRNNGNGTFTDVTARAGVGDKGFGMACAAADIDNDGDLDLFVANYGSNVLYRNNGDGTFADVTEGSGLEDDRWQIGSTFLDYDNDGFVDLYVGNYLVFDPNYNLYYAPDNFPGPLAYHGQQDRLYHNNGDWTFTDVTEKAGIVAPEGRAMGVSAADLDNDGDMDIMVANDAMANSLYRNDGKGAFTDIGLESGTAFSAGGDSTSAMGMGFGDFDRNGWMDMFVPDMGYKCVYMNLGGGLFEDRAVAMGVASSCGQYISWAGEVFDYDHDAWPDVLMINGNAHKMFSEEAVLLRNIEGRRFEDVSGDSGSFFTDEKYVGRGAASGDMDNDGDVDAVILNLGGPAILLRNEGGTGNHWLGVKLVGTRSNRCGIGARVTVMTGEVSQIQDIKAGSGYLSMSDLRANFGLGSAPKADRVEVRWPNGTLQSLENVKADQYITITEPPAPGESPRTSGAPEDNNNTEPETTKG